MQLPRPRSSEPPAPFQTNSRLSSRGPGAAPRPPGPFPPSQRLTALGGTSAGRRAHYLLGPRARALPSPYLRGSAPQPHPRGQKGAGAVGPKALPRLVLSPGGLRPAGSRLLHPAWRRLDDLPRLTGAPKTPVPKSQCACVRVRLDTTPLDLAVLSLENRPRPQRHTRSAVGRARAQGREGLRGRRPKGGPGGGSPKSSAWHAPGECGRGTKPPNSLTTPPLAKYLRTEEVAWDWD